MKQAGIYLYSGVWMQVAHGRGIWTNAGNLRNPAGPAAVRAAPA
jgi:hypothetical protein